MNFKNLLLNAAALSILSVAAVSCTNEVVTPYPGAGSNAKSMLVHNPDLYAWSGGDQFNGTRAGETRAIGENAYFSYTEVEDEWVDEPNIFWGNYKGPEQILRFLQFGINEWVDPVDRDWIDKEWIKEGPWPPQTSAKVEKPAFMHGFDGLKQEEAESKLITDLGFKLKAGESFTFYPYQSGQTNQETKEIGILYYDADGAPHEVIVWNSSVKGYENGKITGLTLTAKTDCAFAMFFTGEFGDENGYWRSTYYYSIKELNEDNKVHVGLVPQEEMGFYKGSLLLIEDSNADGDVDFNDFMIFFKEPVTPTTSDDVKDGLEDNPTTDKCPVPECGHPKHDGKNCDQCEEGTTCHPSVTPDPEDEVCDVPGCGHPKHDGKDCDQCKPGTECHPNGTTEPGEEPGVTPGESIPASKHHNDEVEVNFSINDVHTDQNGQKYEAADLWTKLSIHVRKGTDVKIHVPLPGKYFCESDDFAIFQEHANGVLSGVGNPNETLGAVEGGIYKHSMVYHIEKDAETSWDVTLFVQIDENGMDVWTDGIDEALIDYLFEKNGDGINFEIWNYYQTETVDWINGEKHVSPTLSAEDYELFQGYLDKSTIDFLDEDPSFYINAFGYNWTNGTYSHDIRPKDCLVTPLHKENFQMHPNYCYHLNGTPWNIIWINNKVDKASGDYERHTNAPNPTVAVDKY